MESEKKRMEFFLAMVPPTATAQERRIGVRNGRAYTYEPQGLKNARLAFLARLARHAPESPLDGPVELVVTWCFPKGDGHEDGEWRTTRPDTDNLEKLFKDCMTKAGFWADDALVCREIVEKFWADVPGVRVRVSEL